MAVKKALLPVLFLFVFVNAVSVIFREKMELAGFDNNVMIIGNLFLCFITIVSFLMLNKGMHATSTEAFLRSVYGSFMIKLLLVAGIIFGYAFMYKDKFNKPALFTCMFLYLVYTFIEVRGLLKLSKEKPNA